MLCLNCGKEIPDDSTFCPACGAKLIGGKKEPKSKLRIILRIVLIFVLLATSFAGYQVIKSRSGKDQKVATLIPYRKGDKWGYCDRNKRLVIPVTYDFVDSFSHGLAYVMLNGKYGYIDTNGDMKIPAVYDDAYSFGDGYPFSEGLASVILNGKWGLIDTKGKMKIPAVYDYPLLFTEGLALVSLNGELGFIDTNGTQYWEN